MSGDDINLQRPSKYLYDQSTKLDNKPQINYKLKFLWVLGISLCLAFFTSGFLLRITDVYNHDKAVAKYGSDFMRIDRSTIPDTGAKYGVPEYNADVVHNEINFSEFTGGLLGTIVGGFVFRREKYILIRFAIIYLVICIPIITILSMFYYFVFVDLGAYNGL